MLDGDREHAELITTILTKERLASTLVVLTVYMSRPWTIAESLASWTALLQDHLKRLGAEPELYELKKLGMTVMAVMSCVVWCDARQCRGKRRACGSRRTTWMNRCRP